MIVFKSIFKKLGNKNLFNNFSLQINQKEFICIIGSSGVGKSTFFNLLIGKELIDKGEILIDGLSIKKLDNKFLQYYRRKIGFIFQDFKLINKKTVFENIAFILEICGEKKENIFLKVKKVLKIVGLEEKIAYFPSELSGGEKQRVAIARSIIHNPKIILADEPTGNLDPENTKIIIDILNFINKDLGVTIILTTHNPQVLEYLNTRVIHLQNGKVSFDGKSSNYKQILNK